MPALGLLAVVAVVLAVLVPLGYQVSIDQFSGSIPSSEASSADLFVFVHRVNSAERLSEVVEIARAHSNLSVSGRPVKWAVEFDLQYGGAGLRVAHDPQPADRSLQLSEMLDRTPKELPVILDLKGSLESDPAIDTLRRILNDRRDHKFIAASFNPKILASVGRRTDAATCFLSWQINPSGHAAMRIYEFYKRLSGAWGGFARGERRFDFLAFPWESVDAEITRRLLSQGVRIVAGSVDSSEAFVAAAERGAYGVFTDSPEALIAASANQRPSP